MLNQNTLKVNSRRVLRYSAALIFGLLSACGGDSGGSTYRGTSIDLSCLAADISTLPVEGLSAEEEQSLIFMREEEKLARDVYLYLGDYWGMRIFNNIADSEQTHMDAVLQLLDRYSIADPAAGNAAGVFTNTDLQQLYNDLVDQGDTSVLEALIVGALIEDLDIYDLQDQLDNVVDNQDISLVWANLQKGSRNHLRAFVDLLVRQNYTYTPQYIDQQTYQDIIESPKETGNCLN